MSDYNGLVVTEEGEIVETIPGAASLSNLAQMHYDASQQIKAWEKLKHVAESRLLEGLREKATEFNGIIARKYDDQTYAKTDNEMLVELIRERWPEPELQRAIYAGFLMAASGFRRGDLGTELQTIYDRATEHRPKRGWVTTDVVRQRLPVKSDA